MKSKSQSFCHFAKVQGADHRKPPARVAVIREFLSARRAALLPPVTALIVLLATVIFAPPGFSQTTPTRPPGLESVEPVLVSDRAAARFLDQTTFGPTPDSIQQVQQMGMNRW